MNLEWWWLLAAVPVLFGLGWVAARLDVRQLLSEGGQLPRSYFRGLNFLLNEQPDKAIDAFVEVAKLDPETVELHFALGNLFRRRGETERAIRVHQNLVNRPGIDVRERDHALFELGQDFLRAGMLDRAEDELGRLIGTEAYGERARAGLLQIYELEKDWTRAIAAAKELMVQSEGKPLAEGEQPYAVRIAQFHCELAQEALRRGDGQAAQAEIRAALEINPDSTRAMILRGDIWAAAGEGAAAIQVWRHIQPAWLPLVAERLLSAYSTIGHPEQGLEWLEQQLGGPSAADLVEIARAHVGKLRGGEAATEAVRKALAASPGVATLAALCESKLQEFKQDPGKPRALEMPEIELAAKLLRQQASEHARYTCRDCGFRARLFYWQCPGCSRWETYPPVRSGAAQAAPSMN
ncbi:MAG: lipopolysaccharide assembly protein LapB [Candidatus Protistobacter heckmanni]|nr:lipopolysaccharide assembly protein LapB [Candidatus Protistobacter heckmanni]